MLDGVLYVATEVSQAAAIDAATGETLWTYDPESWRDGRPANIGFQHRGVAAWRGSVDRDGRSRDETRIFLPTHDRRLIALDGVTGEPVGGFGDGGEVDLLADRGLTDFGRRVNPRAITHSSPPAVVGDTVVVGSVVSDGPLRQTAPPGHVRGYDVRTGELKWIFHTIPQEGEVGVDTWENDSWKYSGNTNVWNMMTVDEELGYIYLPVSTPTNDFYGGHRLGDNLFAESIVCLDADTGERVWHFQAVHHGLWDYDFPTPPQLVDITVDGREIKALAQVSKQAFTYVFNRVTGEEVWPIEERPVPESDVPGERASPTQPFPTKPPPFDRQGVSEDDLIDLTPELLAEAKEIASGFRMGPLFTPPSTASGVLMLPSAGGGANWPGAAVDPETGVLYVPSSTSISVHPLSKPDPARSNLDYIGSFFAPNRQPARTAPGQAAVGPGDGDRPECGRAPLDDPERPRAEGPPGARRSRPAAARRWQRRADADEDAALRHPEPGTGRGQLRAPQRVRQADRRVARARSAAGYRPLQPDHVPGGGQAVHRRRGGRRLVLCLSRRDRGGSGPGLQRGPDRGAGGGGDDAEAGCAGAALILRSSP